MSQTALVSGLKQQEMDDVCAERFSQREIEAMRTDELLAAYKRTGLIDLKWALVLRYQGLVKSIALQIRGVYSSFAQVDDIINEGVLTLLDGVDKFDPEKGIKFETYVSKRIRGMIIDLARRQDWMPRSVRRRAKEIDKAVGELYCELGRFPSDTEVSEKLGITTARYRDDLTNVALCNVMSLEALFEEQALSGAGGGIPDAGLNEQPEHMLEEKELSEVLTSGISSLRENEQLVLSLYYQKNLNIREIAHIMGVSEPRISQIHTKAVQKLRVYMQQYMVGGK